MGDLETELLKWAAKQQPWQQDLLRQLARGEILATVDYRAYADEVERAELAKPAPWFEEPTLPQSQSLISLDVSHLRATAAGRPTVSIGKVTHLEGANDLAKGAALEFKATGLTIVAGRNGSGKSGYTRILKQVAASRGPETVLANAFKPGVAPKAVIGYQVGGSTAQDLTWKANTPLTPSPLQRVRIFDARSAIAHLAGSTEIAYVPPTLQILSDYTSALLAIGKVISDDLQRAHLSVRTWPNLETGIGLDVFEHLGEAQGVEALKRLSVLSEVEVTELGDLPEQLRALTVSDPARLAVQARSRAGQLSGLAKNISLISDRLDVAHIEASIKVRERVIAAEVAVAEASKQISCDFPLAATGSAKWRAMWLAAKEFAEESMDHEFPNMGDEAVCALCQQPLGAVARERFTSFVDFMKGEAQIELDESLGLRRADIATLNALPLTSSVTQDLVELVSTYDKTTGGALLPLIATATSLRDWLVTPEIPESDPADANALSADIQMVSIVLTTAAEAESTAAEKYGSSDSNALEANRLQLRQQALLLRKELGADESAIGERHDLAIRIARLGAALKSCDTTTASKENTKLSKEYVDNVCATFTAEAKSLGLDRVPVELIFDKSSRGVSYLKVSLIDAPNIAVATVLSDGEQRVTAIAGFFADLTEAGDESTLVFDDPVSSLDQAYREAVAKRLLIEAEKRQVLIFTHDFTFVQYLYEQRGLLEMAAAKQTPTSTVAEIEYVHIARSRSGAGEPTTAEQWRHVSVRERIKRLNERIQNAGVLHRNNDEIAYEKEARDIAGAIRETWEYCVEQELLDGIVQRHERAIQTKRLKRIVDISDTDVAAVYEGMDISSRWLTGHAAPTSDATQIASPDQLQTEIKKLKDFREKVVARRKGNK